MLAARDVCALIRRYRLRPRTRVTSYKVAHHHHKGTLIRRRAEELPREREEDEAEEEEPAK